MKVEGNWSRDGILRVEIISDAPDNYTLADSYKKEYGPFEQFAYEQELAANLSSINSTDLTNDSYATNDHLSVTDHTTMLHKSSDANQTVSPLFCACTI